MENIYDRILEQTGRKIEDYVVSNRSDFRKDLQETTAYIEKLPIAQKQKEVLLAKMKYHGVLIEDCLTHLEDFHAQCQEAMRQRFKLLPPEKQREIVAGYPDQLKMSLSSNELQEFAKFPNNIIKV